MEAVKLTLSTETTGKRRGRSYAQGRAPRGARPQTRQQWQEAVNGAQALLLLDSARQYGLVTGGPSVNVARCLAVQEQGAAISISPRDSQVNAMLRDLAK